eukprot:gene2176-12166_t
MGNCLSGEAKGQPEAVLSGKDSAAAVAPAPAKVVDTVVEKVEKAVETVEHDKVGIFGSDSSGRVETPEATDVAVLAKKHKVDEAALVAAGKVMPKEHKLDETTLEAAGKVVEANPEGGAIDVKNIPEALIGNLLDPENGPAKGLAYEVHYLGPPRPPCEDARLATTCALGKIDGGQDPEIANILRVIGGIFQSPVALCALFDKKRVFISDAEGGVVPRGDFPWRWTLCGWSLAFTSPMILVIPDTHEDARFRDNLKVTKSPNLRFYCGAPLIASNGHRLGTLCFVDTKPRVMDAASCMIMNNFSELVVRQLEKDIALNKTSQENTELAATYGQLERTMDAFEKCVVLLDTQAEGWKVVFANAVFSKLTGVDREKVVQGLLSDLMEGLDSLPLPNTTIIEAAAAGKAFELAGARIQPALGGSMKPFVLRFRPAGKDFLDDSTMPIGVPAFLPTTGGMHSSQRFYFMSIETAASIKSNASSIKSGASSIFSVMTYHTSKPADMEGLDMGHLLGKGSFGSVYYGTWYGSPVAVKVIEQDLRSALAIEGASLEAILSTNLRHPLIVSTLKYTVKKLNKAPGSSATFASGCQHDTITTPTVPPIAESKTPADSAAWGVMQFNADAEDTPGELQMPQFESSVNTSNPSNSYNSNFSKTVELASALQYLHSKDVVHGDLSGWNCMLSSSGSTSHVGGRNFVAKIADFGLSRTLDIQSKIQTRNYGTMTHMPPETLISGVISKATDVYSFGVLMWQMYTMSRPWSGLSHAQIIMKVGTQGSKLVWPKMTPPGFKALADACMDNKLEKRPPLH